MDWIGTRLNKFTCILAMIALLMWCVCVEGKELEIKWSPMNKIFAHHLHNYVELKINDRISFHCDTDTPAMIYRVNRTGYDTCSVPANAEVVALCEKGSNDTIVVGVRGLSALPGHLLWEEGKDYYLISTSDGTREGINITEGGLCDQFDMRLGVIVVEKKRKLIENLQPQNSTNTATSNLIRLNTTFSASPTALIVRDDRVKINHRAIKTKGSSSHRKVFRGGSEFVMFPDTNSKVILKKANDIPPYISSLAEALTSPSKDIELATEPSLNEFQNYMSQFNKQVMELQKEGVTSDLSLNSINADERRMLFEYRWRRLMEAGIIPDFGSDRRMYSMLSDSATSTTFVVGLVVVVRMLL